MGQKRELGMNFTNSCKKNSERRELRILLQKLVWETEMGRQGIARMKENGERLAEFRALNDLVMGGKLFNH